MTHASFTHRVIEDLKVEFFRRGMSQQDIANKTGLSQAAVSRRFSGAVSPSLADVDAMAAAADLEVRYSVTAEPEGVAS